MPATPSGASYRELFAAREYRAMFGAFVLSVLGDQMATVALTVHVYRHSGSALLAATAYSLAFLPWLLGGPLLATLADRWPRRRVMIGCDLVSFVLIGAAAVPGLPLAVTIALVAAAAFVAPLFDAARLAALPQLLDEDDRYVLATSVTDISHQAAVLLGLVAGGSLVAVLSPSGAFAVDAVTFLASALLVWRGVRPRPVSGPPGGEPPAFWRETAEGVRAVLSRPQVRGLVALVWLSAVYVVVPEAVAVAFAAERGLGATAVGVLMAAAAAGCIVGNLAVARVRPPSRRLRLMGPICLLGTLPLLLTATEPGLVGSVLLFALAGAGSAGSLPAKAAVMTAVPDDLRGRVGGVAATGMNVTQLLAIVAAGAAAEVLPATTVIALAGALTILPMAALWRQTWRHLADDTPSPPNPSAERALRDT